MALPRLRAPYAELLGALRMKIAFIQLDQPQGAAAKSQRPVRWLRSVLGSPNPDFEAHYAQVRYWLLETQDSKPVREIGIRADGSPIVVGPLVRNRGLSTDSPITLDPAEHPNVTKEEFEVQWQRGIKSAVRTGCA